MAQRGLPQPPIRVGSQYTIHERWVIDCGLFEGLKSQDWYINGELEPDAPWNGKSVLTQWLNEVEKDGITQLKCCVPLVDRADEWCPSPKVFSRLDRALAHVRNHLGHKPFVCEGLPNCKQEVCTARFPSAEYLHAHWLGPKYLLCEGCGSAHLQQNIARHQSKCAGMQGQPHA